MTAFCSNCGSPSSPSARFCSICGAPQDGAESAKPEREQNVGRGIRNRRWAMPVASALLGAVAVVVAVVGTGVTKHGSPGGSASTSRPGPNSRDQSVTFLGRLIVDVGATGDDSGGCYVNNRVINRTSRIVVTDGGGAVVGAASLPEGFRQDGSRTCQISFSMPLAAADFYTVQIGSAQPISLSRPELADSGGYQFKVSDLLGPG